MLVVSRAFSLLLITWLLVDVTYLPQELLGLGHHMSQRSVLATQDYQDYLEQPLFGRPNRQCSADRGIAICGKVVLEMWSLGGGSVRVERPRTFAAERSGVRLFSQIKG